MSNPWLPRERTVNESERLLAVERTWSLRLRVEEAAPGGESPVTLLVYRHGVDSFPIAQTTVEPGNFALTDAGRWAWDMLATLKTLAERGIAEIRGEGEK